MIVPHLFCFGLGYTGLRTAQRMLHLGWKVSGTCRDEANIHALLDQGIDACVFSGDANTDDGILAAISGATHILITVPPGTDGDPVWLTYGNTIERNSHPTWIGYLSTTGVYGNTEGKEVDETAPVMPSGPRGQRRVAAERDWLSLWRGHQLPVHIFRLPGIYGPGRCALDQARRGNTRRIQKPNHLFNRIHVDDIVQTLVASMERPNAGAIYNVCDDAPAAPADVTTFACDLLGVTPSAPIPFDEAREEVSEMALSFWNDNRRVSNARIKDELGVSLLYPSYREGLTAINRQESTA